MEIVNKNTKDEIVCINHIGLSDKSVGTVSLVPITNLRVKHSLPFLGDKRHPNSGMRKCTLHTSGTPFIK